MYLKNLFPIRVHKIIKYFQDFLQKNKSLSQAHGVLTAKPFLQEVPDFYPMALCNVAPGLLLKYMIKWLLICMRRPWLFPSTYYI